MRSRAGRPLRLGSRALRTACLVAVLPLSARGEPVDRNQHHRQALETFTEQDGDRDGKLTLVEYVDARFEEIAVPAPPPAGASPEAQAEAPPPPGS